MKKIIALTLIGCFGMSLLTGCACHVGGGPKSVTMVPTTGQQLIDLQKAKDSGAISDTEYQTQKSKLLGSK
ncbi:MAG: SHOCT domain-containing protein [Verrucomicrobiota bacterium]